MSIDDFEIWFEVNKVISNRKPDMDGLKELFEKCWNDCRESQKEKEKEIIQNLNDEINSLRDDNDVISDEAETLRGCIIDIQNIVEEAKTLKEAKQKVSDYSW